MFKDIQTGKIKWSVPLLISFLLGACGGGGDTSSPIDTPPPIEQAPPPSELTVSIDVESISVEELTTASVPLNINYTGEEAVNVSVSEATEPALSASYDSGVLAITLDAFLTTDFSEVLTVAIEAGDLSSEVTLEVAAVNTSRNQLITLANEQLSLVSAFGDSKYQEVVAAGRFTLDALHITGLIDESTKSSMLVDITDNVSDSVTSLKTAADAVAVNIQEQAAEDVLQGNYDAFSNAMDSAIAALNSGYEPINAISAGVIPPIAFVGFSTSQQSTGSLFIENPNLGSGSGETFIFNDSYQFLSAVIAPNAFCEV